MSAGIDCTGRANDFLAQQPQRIVAAVVFRVKVGVPFSRQLSSLHLQSSISNEANACGAAVSNVQRAKARDVFLTIVLFPVSLV